MISKDWTCGSDCKDYYCYEKLAAILTGHAAEVERLTADYAAIEARCAGLERERDDLLAAMRSKDPIQAANNRVFEYHQLKGEVERLEAKAYETKCYCDGYMAELEKMDAEASQLRAERDAAVARAEESEADLAGEQQHVALIELERDALQAKLAAAEDALRKITRYHPGATYDMDDYVYDLKDIASAALADTTTDEVQP